MPSALAAFEDEGKLLLVFQDLTTGDETYDVGRFLAVRPRRDGTVEHGRNVSFQGAHVEGHNHESIGICLVGGVRRDPDADGKNDADGPRWEPPQHAMVDELMGCGKIIF